MKHARRLVTLVCLASLTGCAAQPEDIDSAEQAALVDPGTGPTPIPQPTFNPCTADPADATFTLPSPLASSASFQSTGTAEPGGLYSCDFHVVEFRNVDGVRQYTGFNAVSVGTSTFVPTAGWYGPGSR